MKNIYMTVITIITVCCVVGGTLYHVGGFWEGYRFWGSAMTKNMGVELGELNGIDVDMDLASVDVVAGDKFYLSCKYTDGLEPVYNIEKNGTLSIKQKFTKRLFGMSGQYCDLTLTVPRKAMLDKISVQTAFGDIELDGIAASKCEIQTNAGECVVRDCSFNGTDINADMGEVSVSGSALGVAEVDSDMGGINVSGCTFSELDAETSMGDVTVKTAQNLDGYDMDLGTDMGSVRVNGDGKGTRYSQKGSGGSIKLMSSMGNVRLDYGK